jgi:hypothetical protein
MSLGIKQYVVLAFSCNFILVAVKGWDWLQPSSCKADVKRGDHLFGKPFLLVNGKPFAYSNPVDQCFRPIWRI